MAVRESECEVPACVEIESGMKLYKTHKNRKGKCIYKNRKGDGRAAYFFDGILDFFILRFKELELLTVGKKREICISEEIR